MSKIVIFTLFLVTALYSSTIKSIRFDGLVHLSSDIALEIMGISEGDIFDIESIDKGIKKLYAQNYFKDISVEDVGSGKLVVHVIEKPVIAQIELSGIGENDKKSVLTELGISKGEVYDETNVKKAKKRIEQFYENKGYFNTVVETNTKELNKNSLVLSFIINRGEYIIIKKVKLCGAKEFDYEDLRTSIANREEEALSWMWGFDDGKLRLKDLEYDSSRIKDYYLRHGYLDVTVSNSFLKAYMDGYTATLTYNIYEGAQYKVKSVDIIVPKGLIDVKKSIEDLLLQPGKVFSSKRLRRDIKTIEDKIADLGYAYVRVIPDIKNDRKSHLATVKFIVDPGEKVYINDVRISGNTKTIDRVVRREIYLAAGDLYNRTDLKDSRTALKRTGYFEDAKIKEIRVSKNKIDLEVKVKEARTASIGGGIGYGSSDGLLLNANLSDDNIFGSGINAKIDVERSDAVLSGTISLRNPRVFDSIYSLGGSIYKTDYDYTDYDEENTGFKVNVGRKFGRNWRGSLGYILERSQLSDLSDTLDPTLYTTDSTVKSAVVTSVLYNSTDDFYLARRGIKASGSVEFAGLGGDEKFVSFKNKLSYFYGLEDKIDYDLILRYRGQFNYIVDNGYLPIGEKLYMGGITTVRGYSSRTVSPKNSNGDLLGGKIMLVNSFEASFPLIERLKVRGALFFDYGMIGEDNLDIKRAGTGITFEWVSPLGPINLIFAKALLEEAGDDTSNFEFTMGRQF